MAPPIVVLGLGNPGARYVPTRHNLGFRVIDRLVGQLGASPLVHGDLARRAWTAEGEVAAGKLVLAKPRTYMNHSGRAAVALCRHFAVPPAGLILVYDDADLKLGRMRIRGAGSAGGHRGVRSVIEALGSQDFPRLRLGVRGTRREEQELEDYVLAPFEPAEEPVAAALVELAATAIRAILELGLEPAMNRFNGARVEVAGQGDGW